MATAPLSDRQKGFVREYLIDRNGTQAAIRAGYAPGKGNSSAEVAACRLLSDDRIAHEIRLAEAKADAHVIQKLAITKERIADGLAAIAFPVDPDAVPTNVRRQSLMDLGKLMGHIVERREHRVINGVTDLTDEELTAVEMDMMRRIKGAH